jgi:hypothetical protein
MIPSFTSYGEDDTGTVFRDVIFIMMLTFLILFLAALVHINEPSKKEDEVAIPPGNIQVDISWQTGLKSDVDLWMKGPTDSRPVGYSNRSGILFNLLRDDLGQIGDTTPLNYENGYTHGVEDGEYIINVHMYSARDPLPVAVVVVVKYGKCHTCRPTEIITRTVLLESPGQEITVVRFTIEEGEVVRSKTNYIPIRIRSADYAQRPGGF